MARSTHSNLAVPNRSAPPGADLAHPAPGAEASGRPAFLNLLVSLRPGQWTKNLLVFAGLVFARQLFVLTAVVEAAIAFAVFCALSGVVYLVNDIVDRESDRQHPTKSRRPIAAGAVSVPAAAAAATVLTGAALTVAFAALGAAFGIVAVSYLALLGLYS